MNDLIVIERSPISLAILVFTYREEATKIHFLVVIGCDVISEQFNLIVMVRQHTLTRFEIEIPYLFNSG